METADSHQPRRATGLDAMMQPLAIAEELRAPFPWFGGKSAIADQVWSRLGNVENYVEPFWISWGQHDRPQDPPPQIHPDQGRQQDRQGRATSFPSCSVRQEEQKAMEGSQEITATRLAASAALGLFAGGVGLLTVDYVNQNLEADLDLLSSICLYSLVSGSWLFAGWCAGIK
jgi:hypothetical protein